MNLDWHRNTLPSRSQYSQACVCNGMSARVEVGFSECQLNDLYIAMYDVGLGRV